MRINRRGRGRRGEEGEGRGNGRERGEGEGTGGRERRAGKSRRERRVLTIFNKICRHSGASTAL